MTFNASILFQEDIKNISDKNQPVAYVYERGTVRIIFMKTVP